ncbi:hypothetical protein ACQVP2_27260 [Methylobacterium aquaticum]|uniref:hypothetical protein n=1 Tax=Methylobacterium aquaticum TaxID=270351 RepID=UPI003D1836BC
MARAPFGFAPWPAVPTGPDDEATPVGLAPGRPPVDPRRDGMIQPTAAGKAFSGLIRDFVQGGPAPMEPTLTEYQQGAEFQPGQTRRPGVLPITTDAQTGNLMLAIPKWADVLGSATPSAVGSALAPVARAAGETVLGSGPIRAYHGTPHSFDKFDIKHIGSGEGNQAYGHGLYFAENEDIARWYRDVLTEKSYTANGAPITDPIGIGIARDALDHNIPIDLYINNRTHTLDGLLADFPDHPAAKAMHQEVDRARELQASKLDFGHQGHMYEVAIDANPRSFLDYDRPLAEQNLANLRDVVRPTAQSTTGGPEAEVMRRLQTDPRWGGGWDEDRAWRHLRDAYPAMNDADLQRAADGVEGMVRGTRAAPLVDMSLTGEELLRSMNRQHGPAGTAKLLNDAGIPGVRYFDASSRKVADGSRNIVTFGDDLVTILRKYGVAGAAGAGGAAAALAPDDARASPSPSGASPMAFGFGSLSGLPADVLMRQRQGMPGPLTLDNPVATMLGPDQAPARAPAAAQSQAQQEPPPVAPFSFAGLAPRMPTNAAPQGGFGPGSPSASLPLPPQEPATTASLPPRPVSSNPVSAAPSRAMTSAPLPPPRPPEFGSSADPGRQLDVRPPAQVAAVSADGSGPDFMTAWKSLGESGIGDQALALASGLLSAPGTAGFARGFAGMQAAGAQTAAQDLAKAKAAVERQKLGQVQAGYNATVEGLVKKGVAREDAMTAIAAAQAGQGQALQNLLNNTFRKQEVPLGFAPNPDGSLKAITGGPQDPATKEADAAAQARGAAAGKPDETYTLLPEDKRVAMGLPAGSYQVDSKNKISPVNPTGTTINMGAEKAQDAKVGGGYGEYQLSLATQGRNAASTLNTLALMEQAMKTPGFYSGVGGDGVKRANQFLAALGVKDAKAASGAEVFDALSNKVVLDGLGGSLGPGISNTDRDYISRTAPTLQQSEQGNRDLIGIARALAQRQQAVAKLARDYAAKNGGRIDGGFDQALEEFAANNPLFPQASAGAVAAPPQEPPRGLPQGARQARDGMWYAPDPNRPGKYLRVEQ